MILLLRPLFQLHCHVKTTYLAVLDHLHSRVLSCSNLWGPAETSQPPLKCQVLPCLLGQWTWYWIPNWAPTWENKSLGYKFNRCCSDSDSDFYTSATWVISNSKNALSVFIYFTAVSSIPSQRSWVCHSEPLSTLFGSRQITALCCASTCLDCLVTSNFRFLVLGCLHGVEEGD